MVSTPCCEKIGLKKGKWTAEEDEILTKYIQTNGEGSWRSLPKKAGLLRCGKSCRLRWTNYLRRDLKRGNITAVEEQIIVKLHSLIGSRWSVIATQLPGRTDNEIKNYWNSHLRRKIYAFTSVSKEENNVIVDDTILRKIYSSSSSGAKNTNKTKKKKNGRTSRSSMKTYKQMVTASQCSPQQKELESGMISEEGQTGSFEGECFEPYKWLDSEIERLMSSFVLEYTSEEAVIGVNDNVSGQNKVCESVDNSSSLVERERERSVLGSDSKENNDKDWWVGLCNSSEVGFGIDEQQFEWEFQGSVTHRSDDIWNLSDIEEILLD